MCVSVISRYCRRWHIAIGASQSATTQKQVVLSVFSIDISSILDSRLKHHSRTFRRGLGSRNFDPQISVLPTSLSKPYFVQPVKSFPITTFAFQASIISSKSELPKQIHSWTNLGPTWPLIWISEGLGHAFYHFRLFLSRAPPSCGYRPCTYWKPIQSLSSCGINLTHFSHLLDIWKLIIGQFMVNFHDLLTSIFAKHLSRLMWSLGSLCHNL